MTDRYVYDLSEGSAEMKPLLGGKGAGVAEMTRLGVPVPDGFTVTTEACVDTMTRKGEWPEGLDSQVWRSAPVVAWATSTSPSWSRFAPAPSSRCPA